MRLHHLSLVAFPFFLAALSTSSANAQCFRPAVDSPQGTHPYGPVDPSDGVLDWIELQTNVLFDLEFSLYGMSHEDSVNLGLVAAGYSAVGLAAPSFTAPGFSLDGLGCSLVQISNPDIFPVPDDLEWRDNGFVTNDPVGTRYGLAFQTVQIDPDSKYTTSDPCALLFTQGPPLVDPGDEVIHPYIQTVDFLVDGIEVRLYWPRKNANGTDRPAGDHPLVVFLHGQGKDQEAYDYLLNHLARNGFIAASIERDGVNNADCAERVRSLLDYMFEQWEWASHVENNIALAGHSRGGNAVFAAARLITSEWGLEYDINAIVALAPSDRDQEGSESNPIPESLSGTDSESLLILYGTEDDDIFGKTVGFPPIDNRVASSPFPLYDRAGTEESSISQEQADQSVDKAMIFIAGADHVSFADGPDSPNTPAVPFLPEHFMTNSYVTAFLRWKLNGESQFAPYLRGEWKPRFVRETGTRVMQQYSRGAGRRVIDNFENGLPWPIPTLPGAIASAPPGLPEVEKGILWQMENYSCPHDTSGLRLSWDRATSTGVPFIRWTLPETAPPGEPAYRDMSGFGAISLRLGQVYQALENTEGEGTAVQMRLTDGNGRTSPLVWLDAFTDLGYPEKAEPVGDTTKSSLTTARIPLRYFELSPIAPAVDLTDIRHVDIVFASPDHPTGEIVIDSLELVP